MEVSTKTEHARDFVLSLVRRMKEKYRSRRDGATNVETPVIAAPAVPAVPAASDDRFRMKADDVNRLAMGTSSLEAPQNFIIA